MKIFLASMGLALATAQAASATTFTVFTDRTSFDAALSSSSTEDFNSVVGQPSFNNTNLTIGDLTLNNTNAGDRGFIDQPPVQFASFNVDGTALANIFTGSSSVFNLSFGTAVTAFGADFGSMNDSLQRGAFNVLGQQILAPVQAGSTVQFFGFISDMAFSSLSIESVAGQGDGFGMDNVTYGDVAAVPLPATALLLLGAIGGLAGARRRA